MKKKLRCWIFIGMSWLLFSGCQGVYFHDRGQDFADIWRLGLTYGPGALVNVRATKLVQVGLGGMDGYKFGLQGRARGHWKEFRGEGGVSFIYFINYNKTFISGNETLAEKIAAVRPKDQGEEILADLDPFYGDRSLTEIGFTVHAFAIGVEFAFDFYSFMDFLGGWFLIDPQQDDLRTLRARERTETAEEKTTAKP